MPKSKVNADIRDFHAVVSGFLGAWTDPMGNNVQVKEVCNEIRVSFTDGYGKSVVLHLEVAPRRMWSMAFWT